MARFPDLDEFFSPGLTLTVLGKEYTLPLPSAELGLWCRRLAEVSGEIHAATTDDDMQAAVARANARVESLPRLTGDMSFEERLLGPAYAEMSSNAVPDPYVQFCAQTAYVWVVAGEDAAERYWTSGGRPEAWRPANRQERRAQQTGRTSTAEAGATPTPGSTSGTRSRTTSSKRRNGRGKGNGSHGRTS